MTSRTAIADKLIGDISLALQIPLARYESVDRSYKSLSEWLGRPESIFSEIDVEVYVQGSFRLGTAIRPISDEEEYDLDIVCEFTIEKQSTTQSALHENLGYEIKAYASAHGMQNPAPWRRCWTLLYADAAQFHMDILPSIPDSELQRRRREQAYIELAHVEDSIAITDSDHPNFYRKSDDWPVSNPNGYAEWFYKRMAPILTKRRTALMLAEAKVDISEIPLFRVRTPLQSVIQILKRHRDMQFSGDQQGKPTSIIITTLACHAYNQQGSAAEALYDILTNMDTYIEKRDDVYWIQNPSDPRENFADMWEDEPERREGFFDWLETARTDFGNAASQISVEGFIDALSPRLGRKLVESATERNAKSLVETGGKKTIRTGALKRLFDASHRKPITWPIARSGEVNITAICDRRGFRPMSIFSDGIGLPKSASLRFEATTNIPRPFNVFWQITNTGYDAQSKRGLRGQIVRSDNLQHNESTLYRGAHSIECFIVKDGYCVGQSGLFIVNIS